MTKSWRSTYSIYDAESGNYLYRKSPQAPEVYLSDAFLRAPLVAWEDIYVELPAEAVADGQGAEPIGILTHPQESRKALPVSRGQRLAQDLEIGAILFFLVRSAWKAFFGHKQK